VTLLFRDEEREENTLIRGGVVTLLFRDEERQEGRCHLDSELVGLLQKLFRQKLFRQKVYPPFQPPNLLCVCVCQRERESERE